MSPGQSSCGLLALLQEDLSAQDSVVYRHPNAGSLGGNTYVAHGCCRLWFAFLVCVYVSVCVCVSVGVGGPWKQLFGNPCQLPESCVVVECFSGR